MSSELQLGLESVSTDEYMWALLRLFPEQENDTEILDKFQPFTDSFPELADGVVMIQVIGERNRSKEEVALLLQGAMMALGGLKKVIDARNDPLVRPYP